MTQRTVELIVKIVIEVADWLKILLKDKTKKEDNKNDCTGTSEKK